MYRVSKFRDAYYISLQAKRELEAKPDLTDVEVEKLQIAKNVIRAFEECEKAEQGYYPWWSYLLAMIPPLSILYERYLIRRIVKLEKEMMHTK